ncbi:MAG TPA: hypothetical protein VIK91_25955 [Nannocystis sp.]
MLKNLTLLAVAGLLTATGCVINTTNGSDSDASATGTTTGNVDTDGTSGGTTTDGTATGTDGTSTGTTETPTTGAPTTGAPTTGTDTTGTTDDTTSTSTTGAGDYGNCGWNLEGMYYDCYPGGEPGLVDPDPDNPAPIACPDTLPNADDPCNGMTGPISYLGCCTPEGVLYYCTTDGDGGMIVVQECVEGP